MPELPEVETIRRSLKPYILGKTLTETLVLNPGTIAGVDPETLRRRTMGKSLIALDRRGKFLVFVLSDGARIVIHLRMTGQLVIVPACDIQETRYTCVVFVFDDECALRFDDQRKFGRVVWFPDEQSMNARLDLGPEPIDPDFQPDTLQRIVSGRKRPIKSLLLDQKVIAGMGNIYADEALFRAQIAPTRPAGSLNEAEVARLWQSCRDVLNESIDQRGTTFKDYIDALGSTGQFQTRLMVYGREGKPCLICRTPIRRIVLSGRSSSFCPACQR